ncbi:MAG: ISKra4 family transposase [Candidatus Aeolococcus gillhamiae]|uniref:ISKra4 family transposase n=1 Tax=Candidatus Aeolococcus gillhamiae TaxID=3127015 RepID=A0A2W5ZCI6_9BACT|nr:MAG: ISKra4 family transposase [Candidatus Dormibacter sp. RRmetagenome_bin12]
MLSWLEGTESASMSHAELEDHMARRGREVQRLAFQDHLDLRALRERRVEVAATNGVVHSNVEPGHHRQLSTVMGTVTVERLAYRHPGTPNLCPADAALNLPDQLHSHGLRRLAAIESTRGSFDDASAAICRASGVVVAKRQVEYLTAKAAADVDDFYAGRAPAPGSTDDVLVISVDGKGIVMRPDSLRTTTAKAAATATAKLGTRLSKGEKRYRKRMAEVGAVYDVGPVARSPAEVLASTHGEAPPPAPKASGKWVTASVSEEAAEVVTRVFDEAERRDPDHQRRWVALVDGNNHQIDRINQEAQNRMRNVAIVIDLIHVMEYIWASAWCFFDEGDLAAEAWVRGRALAVLDGNAREVAAGIRRRASTIGLAKPKRKNANACATYLTNKAPYLDYPTALAAGWPIATGVIEGTCRYLVADRMDITGARWSVDGAEAVLKLRAVRSNDDFETYWKWHLDKELQRTHQSRYANGALPIAA